MRALDDYFQALRARDWDGLSACLAEDVRRVGPYVDVVRGRQAYVAFLSRVIPSLQNYQLRIERIRPLDAHSALAEISESVDVDGVRTEFPEVILFELDDAGAIRGVDVYMKQPPRRSGPVDPE